MFLNAMLNNCYIDRVIQLATCSTFNPRGHASVARSIAPHADCLKKTLGYMAMPKKGLVLALCAPNWFVASHLDEKQLDECTTRNVC